MLIFKNHTATDIDEFLSYWSKVYQYPNEEKYQLIHKTVLNGKEVELLFDWKNGFAINGNRTKAPTVEKIVANIEHINSLKSLKVLQLHRRAEFIEHFNTISPIWKIFLLHIIDNEQYPIFDQHVYRTFTYLIKNGDHRELPKTPEKVFSIYTNDYLPFFEKLYEQSTLSKREVDMALWAFGKFLKSDFKQLISISG